MTRIDNPLKWLLDQLPAYIPPDRLDQLLTGHRANKAAYERQIAMNKLTRIITTNERFTPSPDRDARLARWKARLAKLRSEEL